MKLVVLDTLVLLLSVSHIVTVCDAVDDTDEDCESVAAEEFDTDDDSE